MLGKKVLAVMLVALMVSSCFLPLGPDDSDAAEVSDSYCYVISYDSTKLNGDQSVNSAISVDGADPIYHPSYIDGVISGYGSWTWDTVTGIGPFNSFYAAFDINDGNSFAAILNPFDLSSSINSSDSTDYTNGSYNIMWVLPTVYWEGTSNSLTLSNDPDKGEAYAHTIDGHVYRYVAYGVYEGSTATVGGSNVVVSVSGVNPITGINRPTLRTYAHNYTMDSDLTDDPDHPAYSMLWNFAQWQLYKYCAWTVMENFNSQSVVGGGYSYGTNLTYASGATDSLGPYAGTPMATSDDATTSGGDAVKLFIENAWGNYREMVDGLVVNGVVGYYIDSKSTPDDSTSVGNGVQYVADSLPTSDGYPVQISTGNDIIWGMGSSTRVTTQNYGLTDYTYIRANNYNMIHVGGLVQTSDSNAVHNGINTAALGTVVNYAPSYTTSRLAFVFDDGIFTDITISSNNDDYGSVDTGSLTNVPIGSVISVSGSSFSVYGSTVTATKNDDTAQYTFSFEGFTISGSPLTDGTPVTSGMAIVADFAASVNSYVITWSIEGTDTTEIYQYGQTPTHAEPEKQYYTFTGWNPEIVPVTEDATYTAVFAPTIYAVTWNANGGTVEPSVSYGSVESPVSMPTPHYTDYDFAGWFTEPDNGERILKPYYPTSDITLYAHWDESELWELSALLFPLVGILAILAMIALFFRSEGEGLSFEYMTVADMGKAVVGVAVATVIMVLLFFPIL